MHPAVPEGELLRLRAAAQRSTRTMSPVSGRFLPLSLTADALRISRDAGVQASFFGGYEGADRVQVCFHDPDILPEFTGQWAMIRWNSRFSHPDHRSLLGSLLALGMDRSTLGDLVMEQDAAYLYGLPEILTDLPTQWTKAGKDPITVQLLDHPPSITPVPGTSLRDTLPSLRLDVVLASGLNISRSAASEMIRQGQVMVNHLMEERVDRQLTPGALLSIRGHGRIKLVGTLPPNRKQRIPILMEKWTKST